jgi:acyl dehydratase
MRDLRELVGMEAPPAVFEVTRERIRELAGAIGDANPVYQRGDAASPTFPTTFRFDLGIPDFERYLAVHGEEEYVYERPILPTDIITSKRRLIDVRQRQSSLGEISLLNWVTEHTDSRGELIFVRKTTTILRDTQGEDEQDG